MSYDFSIAINIIKITAKRNTAAFMLFHSLKSSHSDFSHEHIFRRASIQIVQLVHFLLLLIDGVFVLFITNKISLCCPRWPGANCVEQVSFTITENFSCLLLFLKGAIKSICYLACFPKSFFVFVLVFVFINKLSIAFTLQILLMWNFLVSPQFWNKCQFSDCGVVLIIHNYNMILS